MLPVCISRVKVQSSDLGLLGKVSWQSMSGDRSQCWWVLFIDVLTSSAFGSGFFTDDSQIVPPLKYLARDTSVILCVAPSDG